MTRRRAAFGVFRHVVLSAWTLIVLFPVAWMVLTSFKDAGDWVSWPTRWFPFLDFEPTLLNYRQIFYIGGTTASGELRREASEQAYAIWKGVVDSGVIVTIASLASLVLGAALAYAISRFRTGGRNYPYTILTVRMLPPIVIAIPMLIYYTSLPEFFRAVFNVRVAFFDTYHGLILLYIVTTLPYVIWMMLAFIDAVPRELEHAARLMGATRLTTLRVAVFPLVGSGKTTTLNLIAGLERPTSGEVYIGDERVTDWEARDRNLGMVFQSLALFPHMTVFDNIAFPLRIKRVPAAEIGERVRAVAATV